MYPELPTIPVCISWQMAKNFFLIVSGEEWDGEGYEDFTLDDHLAWVLEQEYDYIGKHLYNNSGYCVLASIIEAVSGESFADFYQKNFWDALGMRNTYCFDPSENENRSETYGASKKKGRNKFKPVSSPSIIHGDGNIFTTLSDMAIWDNVMRNNELISKSSWEWMCTPGRNSEGYGGGFYIDEESDANIIFHTGAWCGVQNCYMRYLDDDISILTLGNFEGFDDESIIGEIYDIVADEEEEEEDY